MKKMVEQLGFLIDLDACLGCRTCEFACKNEKGRQNSQRRKVISLKRENGNGLSFFSMACNHCQSPACMAVCPQGCIHKKRNGIVVLNSTRCTGCGKCVHACPFQAITLLAENGKADKCDFCYTRQERGELPACVAACIVGAIRILHMNSPEASHYEQAIHDYPMKTLTHPSIRFKRNRKGPHCYWSGGESS